MTQAFKIPPSPQPEPGASTLTSSGRRVTLASTARLPTAFGEFQIFAFENTADGLEHVALVRGAPQGQRAVPVRLHSECLTGDVFSSLKCDCGEQLALALTELSQREVGILLYMRQEGRGIGLANKIRAYALQEQGLDTVQANAHLGFDDDLREYDIAAAMLNLLGVGSVELYTNNPAKIAGLERHGVQILRRLPIQTAPNEHNRAYLETKRRKSGHWI